MTINRENRGGYDIGPEGGPEFDELLRCACFVRNHLLPWIQDNEKQALKMDIIHKELPLDVWAVTASELFDLAIAWSKAYRHLRESSQDARWRHSKCDLDEYFSEHRLERIVDNAEKGLRCLAKVSGVDLTDRLTDFLSQWTQAREEMRTKLPEIQAGYEVCRFARELNRTLERGWQDRFCPAHIATMKEWDTISKIATRITESSFRTGLDQAASESVLSDVPNQAEGCSVDLEGAKDVLNLLKALSETNAENGRTTLIPEKHSQRGSYSLMSGTGLKSSNWVGEGEMFTALASLCTDLAERLEDLNNVSISEYNTYEQEKNSDAARFFRAVAKSASLRSETEGTVVYRPSARTNWGLGNN